MGLYSEDEKRELKIRFYSEYETLGAPDSILFGQWLNTGDPDYLDKLIMDANRDNIEIKGVLLEQVAIAAKNRLLRKYTYTKRTKINQEGFLDFICLHVFKLRTYCNKTDDEATFLVAGALDKQYPLSSKKASTISKEYAAWARGHSEYLEKAKSNGPDKWSKKQQEDYLSQFPNKISEVLRGNRT